MSDPAPIEPAVDDPVTPLPTPEPVIKSDALTALIVLVLTQLNPIARHFDWWDFTGEDIDYVGQLVGLAVVVFITVKAWIVRGDVWPDVKVQALLARARAAAHEEGRQAAIAELPPATLDTAGAPTMGYVRSSVERAVDPEGFHVAVRWDDGTISEEWKPYAIPVGTRIARQ